MHILVTAYGVGGLHRIVIELSIKWDSLCACDSPGWDFATKMLGGEGMQLRGLLVVIGDGHRQFGSSGGRQNIM